jgi:hypothetical protein
MIKNYKSYKSQKKVVKNTYLETINR